MYKILFVLTFLFLIVAPVANASGQYGNSTCQVVYGGGVYGTDSCPTNVKFGINKLIQNPTNGQEFVENLTLSDARFKQGDNIVFQIKVKNTGDTTLQNIEVVDTLPESLTFVSGPGKYDASTRKLVINIDSLNAGNEAIYFINAKVVTSSSSCATNEVIAKTSSLMAEDSSNFCLETSVTEVKPKVMLKTIPQTGPESVLIATLPALLGAGVYLRRKSA